MNMPVLQPGEAKEIATLLPDHWQRKRLRYLSSRPIRNGLGEAADSDDPEHPRYIRITDIAGPRQLRSDTFRSLPPEVAMDALVHENDILISAAGATYGKSFLARELVGEACFAGYLVRLSPSPEVDPSFLAYWMESRDYWAQIDANVIQATIQNFSAAKVRHLNVPLPPLDTQRRIAQFLDEKTERIDALIERKRALLDRLSEKRQALITRAVTKGINPKAPLKLVETTGHQSGGGCSGEMSAYVRVPFLKAVRDATGGNPKVKQGEYLFEGPVPVLDQGQDFISGYTTKENVYTGPLPVVLFGDHTRTFKYVDFLFALGADGVKVFAPREGFEASFLYYYFRNARIPNAGYSRHFKFLRNLSVRKPPLDTQRRIARFLDEKTTQIDGLSDRIVESIDRLAEYRSALITAAVTGQLAELR